MYQKIQLLSIILLLSFSSIYASTKRASYSPPPPSIEELEHRKKMQKEKLLHEKKIEEEKNKIEIQRLKNEMHYQELRADIDKQTLNNDIIIQKRTIEANKDQMTLIVVAGVIILFSIIVTIFFIIQKLREGKEQILENKHFHDLKLKAIDVLKDPNISDNHKSALISLLSKQTPRVERPKRIYLEE